MKTHFRSYFISVFFISGLIFISLVSKGQGADKRWWKETVFYEIFMPSYADSNGDGYGDFKGMVPKLDHLQSLGIKAICLTPFLQSPKIDNGFDVSSYYDIDPIYGSPDDFKNYLAAAHKKGIKVIMDMPLNQTSTQSKWFKESSASISNPYRDYYIWKEKANNWESFFGGSAWQIDTVTNQYYYHKFDVTTADLNWANPKVVEEMQKVLRYWLNLGIDGFRLDMINFLNTDGIIHDNPMPNGVQQRFYDINQRGVKDAIKKMKLVVNEFKDRFIVGEVGSDKLEALKQFDAPDLLDAVFNFNFGIIPTFSTARIFTELQSLGENMQSFPTLFFGGHNMPRLIDQLANGDIDKAKALAVVMLTAKGLPFIYYGEEIGMHNITDESIEEIEDIQGKTRYQLAIKNRKTPAEALVAANNYNRDKSRGPMQWSAGAFAGFSTAKSWIKISPDHKEVNVQDQVKNPGSMLNFYKKIIDLRNKELVLQYGSYEKLENKNDQLSFTRYYGGDKITVVVNFGKDSKVVIPANAKILMGTVDVKTNGFLIYKFQ